MEKKLAIITGADGGMGTEITRAVALAGYRILMACYDPKKAEEKRQKLIKETGNTDIEVRRIDLASLDTVAAFADYLLGRGERVSLLMNNAGTMETERRITVDGLEFVDAEITSADGRGNPRGQYGFMYLCHWTVGFSRIFLERQERQFLAYSYL